MWQGSVRQSLAINQLEYSLIPSWSHSHLAICFTHTRTHARTHTHTHTSHIHIHIHTHIDIAPGGGRHVAPPLEATAERFSDAGIVAAAIPHDLLQL